MTHSHNEEVYKPKKKRTAKGKKPTKAQAAHKAKQSAFEKLDKKYGSKTFGIKRRKNTDKFYFDYAEADRACRFFENNLVHVEDPHYGKPFALEKWQRVIVEDIFGWKRRRDGKRRYKTLYLEIPRKNGKSTFGAGFALYLTFADRERGAQIVSAAADRGQAAVIFDLASAMVEASPKLSALAGVFSKTIAYYSLGNKYTVLSADANTKHGKNIHGILFDELHTQPDRHLVDVLHTSTGTRLQPLEVFMTTAGYDRTSICWEKHDYACKVRDGHIIDDTFYPVIYAADDEDDWTSPSTWKKANPNLGITVTYEYIAEECKTAQEIPAYENTFRRLHLNQWTEQESRMIPMFQWAKCKGSVELEELKGKECWAGLDLASTTDVAALSLVFPIEKEIPVELRDLTDDNCPLTETVLKVLPFFWIPKANMAERFKRNQQANYGEWTRQGLMFATEGNVVDYGAIERFILEQFKEFNIKRIAYDRWNATQITTRLDAEGLDMEPFGQGYASMNAPTKEFVKRIASGKIEHGGHQVLSWMASNVASEQDPSGNIKPSRKKSKEKIDGIVATIMGIGAWMKRTEEGPSKYEVEDAVVF